MKPPHPYTIPRVFPNRGFRASSLPDPLSRKHETNQTQSEQSHYCSSSPVYQGVGLDTYLGNLILSTNPIDEVGNEPGTRKPQGMTPEVGRSRGRHLWLTSMPLTYRL